MAREDLGISLESFGVEQPHNMQAEQSALGAVLVEPSHIDVLIQHLRPEMFYERHNRAVYTELVSMVTAGEPVDVVLLADKLAKYPLFGSVADAKVYLTELTDTMFSLSNLSTYIEIIKDKYLKRLLLEHAREVLQQAGDDVDSKTMLEGAEQRLYEIGAGRDSNEMEELRSAIFDTMHMLQLLSGPNRKDYLGISTGFSYLDHLLTGLSRSDLLILAARPGMGKTSFALNLAMNVAKEDIPVAIFSLEMTKEQLAARILSAEARVDSHIFRTGVQQQQDWEDITGITEVLGPRPVYMDDSAGITVPEMKSKIRRVNNRRASDGQKKLGLIVIDYLQLMSSGRRNENRVQEVSEITRSLKIMAKDLQAPIVVLSQLSRSTEKGRPDHRPMLSDLRDSGSIEQDADIVLFLYREAYYTRDDPDIDATAAECIVAKNRHGETGTVNMIWDGAHTRFYEPEMRREE